MTAIGAPHPHPKSVAEVIRPPSPRVANNKWSPRHQPVGGAGVKEVAIAEYIATASQPDQKNPLNLRVKMQAELEDGATVDLEVLVDTGSEVNIVRRGIINTHLFRESTRPVRFLTASSSIMEGGQREVACQMLIKGIDVENQAEALAVIPI